ncbi:hypothetical protein RFI_24811 [Reticulomyxa filosa]|uniref:RUN domain-containing protein n=1 Tax=Reticulomyxa filosa TaxID=46433 RepID=X6MHL7_RETFI|nr:hypothetical protein RFI_24811 [Reticulomyxa filosa]|eukprot:ETO12565.1 hypothetical protein RFI_24811 [Reticulomyxa filosa]
MLLRYLELLTSNMDVVKTFYEDYGILSHHNHRVILIEQLQEQSHLFEQQVHFELSLSDPLLNRADIIVVDEHHVPQFDSHWAMQNKPFHEANDKQVFIVMMSIRVMTIAMK